MDAETDDVFTETGYVTESRTVHSETTKIHLTAVCSLLCLYLYSNIILKSCICSCSYGDCYFCTLEMKGKVNGSPILEVKLRARSCSWSLCSQ